MSTVAQRSRPPSRKTRLYRAVADSSLVVGMARGMTHGDHDRFGDHLLARAALMREGANLEHEGTPSLLDRVPGWAILTVVAIIVGVLLLLPR